MLKEKTGPFKLAKRSELLMLQVSDRKHYENFEQRTRIPVKPLMILLRLVVTARPLYQY
jgi:hypothetical protein